MEVEIRVTNHFEIDMGKYGARDQAIILKKISFYSDVFKENPASIDVYSQKMHFPITPKSGFTPSLYVMKINQDIRLIATFDSDPIFDQVIVTLLACVRHDDYEKVFKHIDSILYDTDIKGISLGDDNYDGA